MVKEIEKSTCILTTPYPRRLIIKFYGRSPGFSAQSRTTVARQRRNHTGLPYNSRYPTEAGPGHHKILKELC